jgi:hypothetical protein
MHPKAGDQSETLCLGPAGLSSDNPTVTQKEKGSLCKPTGLLRLVQQVTPENE